MSWNNNYNNTMKKLFLLLLIAPVLGFSQSQKKLEKTTKVEIINRYGFDETATFAFYADDSDGEPLETLILFWEEALLSNGLKLGSWKIEDKTIKVDADYFIEVDFNDPYSPWKLKVQDVSSEFKLVATVFFGGKRTIKKDKLFFKDIEGNPYRNYVIKKLLESNKR